VDLEITNTTPTTPSVVLAPVSNQSILVVSMVYLADRFLTKRLVFDNLRQRQAGLFISIQGYSRVYSLLACLPAG
jgi:hypothetical protein